MICSIFIFSLFFLQTECVSKTERKLSFGWELCGVGRGWEIMQLEVEEKNDICLSLLLLLWVCHQMWSVWDGLRVESFAAIGGLDGNYERDRKCIFVRSLVYSLSSNNCVESKHSFCSNRFCVSAGVSLFLFVYVPCENSYSELWCYQTKKKVNKQFQ